MLFKLIATGALFGTDHDQQAATALPGLFASIALFADRQLSTNWDDLIQVHGSGANQD